MKEVAEDFRLDAADVQGALEEVSMYFSHQWHKRVETSD